jgi:hypothetical protein
MRAVYTIFQILLLLLFSCSEAILQLSVNFAKKLEHPIKSNTFSYKS